VSESLRVFISYAREDGASLAQRLQSDLEKHGFDAWLDTGRTAGGAVWSMKIEREIDTRQVMLALLSPGSYGSEICRAEQLRALDKGNRVIPLFAVKGSDSDRPIYLYARQYRDFTNDDNYQTRLCELLADIRSDVTATLPDSYRKTPVTYLTAPPRVTNYLDRPEALQALRDTLFDEDRRQPIALTALAGMGGIGKTVLAKALTEDEVVQRTFPDGIVWLTAGKERKRDFIQEMREVAKALGDDLSRYDNALGCENQYRTTIAKKAALIVLDDVWSKADIEPLLAESPRSRFLFTTRDSAIGRFVGAHEHRADLLDLAQSRELLASWANVPVAELPAEAEELIAECGRLPLALSVLGAILRGADAAFWTDTLDLLRSADLSAIQEQLPEGQESFFKAVEVSFQSLKPDMQERYRTLAVLPEDMAAPMPILETLWNTSEAEARRLSRLFVDRSLAQRHGVDESIGLHDLQFDYVRAQFPDREALDLIHSAVRLSANVLQKDPHQFASQVLGRLLVHQDNAAIGAFNAAIGTGAPKPWLRVLHPTLHQSGTSMVRTLVSHSMHSGVAVTADGNRAISAGPNGALIVWETVTGRVMCTLGDGSHPVSDIAMTPDGRRAVSAHPERLEVWDLSTQSRSCILGGPLGAGCVAISPDGTRAVSAFRNDDVESMLMLRSVRSGLPLTPAEERVVAEARSHSITVWDTETGRPLQTLKGHTAAVNGIAIAAGISRLVSGSDDRSLRVWDLETGHDVRSFKSEHGPVTAVGVTSDGDRALFGCRDGTLEFRDVESGRELKTMTDASGAITHVAISTDGCRAVSTSSDHSLKVWDLRSGSALRTLEGHGGWVTGLALSADGSRAVSTSKDGTIKVWDLEAGPDFPRKSQHSAAVTCVAVTPDGARAISASDDKTLKLWDMATGRELRRLTGHVKCVVLRPGSVQALSAFMDGTVRVWEPETGHCRRMIEDNGTMVYDVAVTGDGKWAISISDEDIRVFDIDAGRRVRILAYGDFTGGIVAVTPNGKYMLSASRNRSLRILDLETDRERILNGHSSWVNKVVVTADGKRAVSGSVDRTAIVWELETGVAVHTLYGHGVGVTDVAVAPNGKHAATTSWDRVVRVWDIETGLLITSFNCDGMAESCSFSSDGHIVVGDHDGRVYFLLLEN
jgi:WD40 repeat protein